MRQRVAGDDPRTDQNDDGKGVKRAEVPPAKLSWLPGWLSFCSVVRLCFWFLVLCLFAPVFLVPPPGLAFVGKGDVPRTDPFVSLPVRGFFQVFPGMLALLGGIVTIFSPSYRLRQYGSPRAFDPPPRVERALRGGCASFSFLLVVLSPLRWCSRSMSQVLSQPCTFLRHSHYLYHNEQDLGCKSRHSFVSDKFGVQANIGEEYAHLRRTEEDLGSEVVFRTDDEWSFEFGPHCFDVAHVYDWTPLPIQLRRF